MKERENGMDRKAKEKCKPVSNSPVIEQLFDQYMLLAVTNVKLKPDQHAQHNLLSFIYHSIRQTNANE